MRCGGLRDLDVWRVRSRRVRRRDDPAPRNVVSAVRDRGGLRRRVEALAGVGEPRRGRRQRWRAGAKRGECGGLRRARRSQRVRRLAPLRRIVSELRAGRVREVVFRTGNRKKCERESVRRNGGSTGCGYCDPSGYGVLGGRGMACAAIVACGARWRACAPFASADEGAGRRGPALLLAGRESGAAGAVRTRRCGRNRGRKDLGTGAGESKHCRGLARLRARRRCGRCRGPRRPRVTRVSFAAVAVAGGRRVAGVVLADGTAVMRPMAVRNRVGGTAEGRPWNRAT